MGDYPYLSLNQIEIDPDLVRQLPRKLAYYHLVLPLARDHDQISVAMAHIDNPLVLDMLETLLAAEIVPVLSSAVEIRTALDQAWEFVTRPKPHILSWGSSAERAMLARTTGAKLSRIFAASVTDQADSQRDDLASLLMLTQQDTYVLTVMAVSPTEDIGVFVRQAATPVLLLYGDEVPPFHRILLSLRGHAPDLSALDWVVPLAKAYQAETTVLAVTTNPPPGQRRAARAYHSLTILLDPTNEPAQHLAECTDRLVEAGIPGYLKLCQGDPIQQIAAEFAKGPYELLVIVSEAHGDFVQGVIDAVCTMKQNYAVLVVKPALTA